MRKTLGVTLCFPITRAMRLSVVLPVSVWLSSGACGCRGAPKNAEPTEPPSRSTAKDTVPRRDAPASARAPQPLEAYELTLSEEALRARYEAQRCILGERGLLFEDLQGRPLAGIAHDAALVRAAEALEAIPVTSNEDLDELPGSSGLGAANFESRVDGNFLGRFVPIEGGAEPPLMHFYSALQRLRAGQDPDGKVRVVVFGASHTDADIYPHYLRTYLQSRFGDGGHGFVHAAKPWRWYRHIDVSVESSKGWRTEHAQRPSGRLDGLYGLLGSSVASKSRRDYGRVIPRPGVVASRYEIYYLQQPDGGRFRLIVDGKPHAKIATRAETTGPGYHTLELPEGEHTVEIRPIGDGEVRVFGMTMEREQPGIVVDTLGIGGTRAANILTWSDAVWPDNLARRAPDLYVLAYGTNESMDEDQPLDQYADELRAVIDRFEAVLPDASCLLVGPGDFPIRNDETGYIPRPRLSQLVAIQQEVAAEMGCGFWDTLAFMGGELAMTNWVVAEPQMAREDHCHLTRRGYVRLGMELTDAMMIEFDLGNRLAAGSSETTSWNGP